MSLAFTKMHGLGNDFVVLDATAAPIDMPPDRARAIADRHTGIGCDQILILGPPCDGADFGYRILNADGSEAGQCGNGVRCLAQFALQNGLTTSKQISVATGTARMSVRQVSDGWAVDMGEPDFAPPNIPMTVEAEQDFYLLNRDGKKYQFGAVSMGNPHAVLSVADVASAPVRQTGSILAQHQTFPDGVNVGFAEVRGRSQVRLRVWERGAGETLACGSGACAAMAVLHRWGLVADLVTVSLPGGDLRIEWKGPGHSLIMTGPATTVFNGATEL